MSTSARWAAAFLCVVSIGVFVGCDGQLHSVDDEQAKATAKDRVYPALVYIKPIQEVFEGGERERAQVVGSGVIIDPNGYVVTNNHVAENAIEVNCVLGDKTQVPAIVVGLDPETDLALLKLKLPDGHDPLPYAKFGDSSKVIEGQLAMALGSPFGFERSISQGIISNTRRYLGFNSQHRFNLWFQTDAAINPGNSGGPLVNAEGRIIGINTLGMWADGIGFSIPANVVTDITGRLRKRADATDPNDWPVKVQRTYTGLQLQPLKDFNSNTFTDANCGVLVRGVDTESPAAKAGIRDGDLLIGSEEHRVDGTYTEELPAIERWLADLPANQEVTLYIARKQADRDANTPSSAQSEPPGEPREVIRYGGPAQGQKTDRVITPKDLGGRALYAIRLDPSVRGKFEGEDLDLKRWNMTVKEISQYKNPTLHFFQPDGGVYIQGVRYEGNASDAGLAQNDIILKIGETKVRTLQDVKAAYDKLINDPKRADKKVLITIKRQNRLNWKTLDWAKDYLKEE
ncbi:MAG: trypsin-like peptidase domain-containing protein [Phycisphaerae bacterium]